MQAENIYALAHGDECDPTFLYVGKTVKTVEERFADHVRGANDPMNAKPAYEYWVKNTQTVTADSYKVNWRTAPRGFTRLDALIRICSDFPTFTWWPMSARDPLR